MNLGILTPPAWVADALCGPFHAADYEPDGCFPKVHGPDNRSRKDTEDDLPAVRRAIAICEACDVTEKCLAWAIENDERWGIWGGMTPKQRQDLKRKGAA